VVKLLFADEDARVRPRGRHEIRVSDDSSDPRHGSPERGGARRDGAEIRRRKAHTGIERPC
jgi:hypothetical protein